MSPRYLPFALAFLAWPAFVHAVRPGAPAEPAASPAPGATAGNPAPGAPIPPPPPYVLKNRSSFNVSASPRPPFWPIGWVHHDASSPIVAAPAPVKVTIDEKYFKVTSILLGSGTTPSLAVVNGRAYSEGEFVRMPRTPGAPTVRVRVQRINDGNVVLQQGAQTLVAPLHREEILAHGDEKLLDDQDRDEDPAPPAAPKATAVRPTVVRPASNTTTAHATHP